jgi:hypothetical protein
MLCNFEDNCDGMNYMGLKNPTLCLFHQTLNDYLSHEDKVFVFQEERKLRLQLYTNNPILKCLRNLKDENKLEEILFCFGEITEEDDSYYYSNVKRQHVKKAFRIVCPNMIIDNNHIRWHEGDMNPIVFDKLIFPDFLFIDKKDLIY